MLGVDLARIHDVEAAPLNWGYPRSRMSFTFRFAVETDASEIHAIYAPVVTNTAISFAESSPPSPRWRSGYGRRSIDIRGWCASAGE